MVINCQYLGIVGNARKMKRYSLKILNILITVSLTGCFGLFDSGSDRIIGKYIVLWIDLQENQTISEQFEINSNSSTQIISEYVFAVGHNDDFIIAKQHPTLGFEGGFEIDTTITIYYVVDMNRKILLKGNKYFGPLTRVEFDSLRLDLNITNIEFDMNYPEKY